MTKASKAKASRSTGNPSEPKTAHDPAKLAEGGRQPSKKKSAGGSAHGAPSHEPPPRVSKQHQLAALLLRDEGATLDQMIAATGWLPHTTRAALTGLRKKGYAIDSDKVDGVRTYRAIAPE
jgi:hypothetical protein